MYPVMTWGEAQDRGLSYYFTGEPCKHSHIELRRTEDRHCCGCVSDYTEIYIRNMIFDPPNENQLPDEEDKRFILRVTATHE